MNEQRELSKEELSDLSTLLRCAALMRRVLENEAALRGRSEVEKWSLRRASTRLEECVFWAERGINGTPTR
jgi:hypothetical protein